MIYFFNISFSVLKFTSILFLVFFLFSFVFFIILILLDRLAFQKFFKKYLNNETFLFIRFIFWDNIILIKFALDFLIYIICIDLFVLVLEFVLEGSFCFFPLSFDTWQEVSPLAPRGGFCCCLRWCCSSAAGRMLRSLSHPTPALAR